MNNNGLNNKNYRFYDIVFTGAYTPRSVIIVMRRQCHPRLVADVPGVDDAGRPLSASCAAAMRDAHYEVLIDHLYSQQWRGGEMVVVPPQGFKKNRRPKKRAPRKKKA